MSTILSNINLNRLVVFGCVVEVGSITGAAERLGMTKAMVSAHVQRLEAEIGASLLIRTTRRLALTEAGESFYEAVRAIVHSAEQAVNAIGQDASDLRGTLRMTAPVDYSASVIMPLAAQLCRRYPLLKIEVHAGDRLFDLVAEGIDVAIRLGRLADSSYQAVRLAVLERWLVAAPSVLATVKTPAKPLELSDMPFIALSVLPEPLSWTFEGPGKVKQRVHFRSQLSTNTAHGVRLAALAGAGVTIVPAFGVADDVKSGRLVRILPKWSIPSGAVYAVFPATRYRPQKVRVFIDALRAHLDPPG